MKKTLYNNYLGFFFLAVTLLWSKTYLAQLTQFSLGIEGELQKFLLFLNPLGSIILMLSLAFLLKGRKKYYGVIGLSLIMSLLLYANVLYYRFFNDYITLPTITQAQNFGDVSGSIGSLLRGYDILFFMDLAVLLALFLSGTIKPDNSKTGKRVPVAVVSIALGVSLFNLALAEKDRPQLLTRGFDRNYIVKYLGMYNYTLYDAVISTKASAQRVLADGDDITEVINFTKSNHARPNPEYFGAGKGMNVIYFHLESMQNFLIDYKMNGEEVTPFLNSLKRDSNTLYFNNFFHQTAQGKTSDAEFILENSLYGLPQGSAFTTKSLNTYQAAPAILGQQGYTSAVFHSNGGSFWNRNEVYKSFGYNRFFDSSYYEMQDGNLTDYGLMDKPFYQQSIPLLESLQRPFYAKFIPVTHHFPYKIDDSEATISPNTTGDPTVDGYFQTARYADEALEQFFNYLKESGLYDNSIIVMYGDHYGNSENRNKAMGEVIGKEITPFESAGLQRVPLFIRVPGIEGGINGEYGGQIDLLPTLLHLLGKDTKNYIQFGTDLLSEEHDELVPFRNGDFVSPSLTFVDGKVYDSATGVEVDDDANLQLAKKYQKAAEGKLLLSDSVINGDLLRFYTPADFIPVDRSRYNYEKIYTNESKYEGAP